MPVVSAQDSKIKEQENISQGLLDIISRRVNSEETESSDDGKNIDKDATEHGKPSGQVNQEGTESSYDDEMPDKPVTNVSKPYSQANTIYQQLLDDDSDDYESSEKVVADNDKLKNQMNKEGTENDDDVEGSDIIIKDAIPNAQVTKKYQYLLDDDSDTDEVSETLVKDYNKYGVKGIYASPHLKTRNDSNDEDQHQNMFGTHGSSSIAKEPINNEDHKLQTATKDNIVIYDKNNNSNKSLSINDKLIPRFKKIVFENDLIEKPIPESLRFDHILLNNITRAINQIPNQSQKKVSQKFLKVENFQDGFRISVISGNDIKSANVKKSVLVAVVDNLGGVVNDRISNHITETVDGRPVYLQGPVSMHLDTVLNMIKSKILSDKSNATTPSATEKDKHGFRDTINSVNKIIYGRQ